MLRRTISHLSKLGFLKLIASNISEARLDKVSGKLLSLLSITRDSFNPINLERLIDPFSQSTKAENIFKIITVFDLFQGRHELQ